MTTFENRRILAVDDNHAIHEDYRKVLIGKETDSDLDDVEALLFGDSDAEPKAAKENYTIDSAYQGQDAFEMVKQSLVDEKPYALAFVDVRMPPGWDGVETSRRIWEVDPTLPIVLCTAYSDHSWDDIVNKLGRTDQLLILKKPFDNVELRQLAASQTEKWRLAKIANLKTDQLEAIVQERTQEICATRDLMFYSLARLAESRDAKSGAHLERMQNYAGVLVKWLSQNGPYQAQINERFVNDLIRSSILHDIGKVGTPDSVLLKPGRLTADEFEVMKQHVTIGAEALDEAASLHPYCSFLKMAAAIARYHHEKYDGSGYPTGAVGDEIPLAARIVAVADVFDALTSNRVYRNADDPKIARDTINLDSGTHFDPAVVEAFNACWEQFVTPHHAPVTSDSLTSVPLDLSAANSLSAQPSEFDLT